MKFNIVEIKGMIKGAGPFFNNMGVYGNDFGPTQLP